MFQKLFAVGQKMGPVNAILLVVIAKSIHSKIIAVTVQEMVA
jgi:hypothetical protein